MWFCAWLRSVCICVYPCGDVGAYLDCWRGEVFNLLKPVKFCILVPFLEEDFDEISPVTAQERI